MEPLDASVCKNSPRSKGSVSILIDFFLGKKKVKESSKYVRYFRKILQQYGEKFKSDNEIADLLK